MYLEYKRAEMGEASAFWWFQSSEMTSTRAVKVVLQRNGKRVETNSQVTAENL